MSTPRERLQVLRALECKLRIPPKQNFSLTMVETAIAGLVKRVRSDVDAAELKTSDAKLQRESITCPINPHQANVSLNQSSPTEDTWRRDFVLEVAPTTRDRVQGTSSDTWTRDTSEANRAVVTADNNNSSTKIPPRLPKAATLAP